MSFQVVSESHPFAEFILCSDGVVEEIIAQDQCSDSLKSGRTNDPKNAVDSVINQVLFLFEETVNFIIFILPHLLRLGLLDESLDLQP